MCQSIFDKCDEDTMKDLREKIKSKMDVAKLLGVLIIAVLSFLLKEHATLSGPDVQWAAHTSVILFLIATALYFATVFAYDSLLMPHYLWGYKERNRNLTALKLSNNYSEVEQVVRLLHNRMLRAWQWMFLPATCAVGGGLLLLAYAVFKPTCCAIIVTVGVLLVIAVWGIVFQPRLGSRD